MLHGAIVRFSDQLGISDQWCITSFHSVRGASDLQESPGQITESNQIVDHHETV